VHKEMFSRGLLLRIADTSTYLISTRNDTRMWRGQTAICSSPPASGNDVLPRCQVPNTVAGRRQFLWSWALVEDVQPLTHPGRAI